MTEVPSFKEVNWTNLKRLITSGILAITLLSTTFGATTFDKLISPVGAQEPQGSSQFWAVLIHGPRLQNIKDADYMYHLLNDHFNFTDIYYLHTNTSDPRVDNASTKANARWAINTWLPSKSSANDTIFIFAITHGGGYQAHDYTSIYGSVNASLQFARWDLNDGDEGDEHPENDVKIHLSHGTGELRLYPIMLDGDGDGNRDDYYKNRDFKQGDEYIDLFVDRTDNTDPPTESYWVDNVFPLHDWDHDGVADDLLIDPDGDNLCDLALNANVSLHCDGKDLDNDGYIDRVDFNEDGDYDDYVGVDECLRLISEEQYWDDEIKSDLEILEDHCKTLIFMTQSCYGGGLIDDLSGVGRIVMTATNETSVAHADLDDDGYCEFAGSYMDALHGMVGADNNPEDSHVSVKEAWDYAWEHDYARQSGLETPWLDDNGNGLPTFINGTQSDPDDGDLASVTWFPKKCVHLTVNAEDEDGDALSSGDVYIDDALSGYTESVFHVSIGQHETFVNDFWEAGETGYRYGFENWFDGSEDNPRSMSIGEDVVVTAIFNKRWCPADVDGDGDVDDYDYDEFCDAYLSIRGDLRWDSRCDFDADGDVDYDDFNTFAANYGNSYLYELTVLAEDQFGNPLSYADVYIDDTLVGYAGSNFTVFNGQRMVFVNDFWESNTTGYRYGFDHWEDESEDNPRLINILENMTVTAYFTKRWCPGDIDGSGVVDDIDSSILTEAYGSHRGDSRWDSRADLDRDAYVGSGDASILNGKYGTNYKRQLTVLAEDEYSNPLLTIPVYIDGDSVGYTGSTFSVWPEEHEVHVNATHYDGDYEYTFSKWEDHSKDNPRTLTIAEDTTITAFYKRK